MGSGWCSFSLITLQNSVFFPRLQTCQRSQGLTGQKRVESRLGETCNLARLFSEARNATPSLSLPLSHTHILLPYSHGASVPRLSRSRFVDSPSSILNHANTAPTSPRTLAGECSVNRTVTHTLSSSLVPQQALSPGLTLWVTTGTARPDSIEKGGKARTTMLQSRRLMICRGCTHGHGGNPKATRLWARPLIDRRDRANGSSISLPTAELSPASAGLLWALPESNRIETPHVLRPSFPASGPLALLETCWRRDNIRGRGDESCRHVVTLGLTLNRRSPHPALVCGDTPFWSRPAQPDTTRSLSYGPSIWHQYKARFKPRWHLTVLVPI